MEDNRDPRLIALMLAGDQEAFGLLITRYQPMAQRLAVQFTRNQDIAHELVQEAMVQAYLSLDQLRDTIRFKSWFYGIVLNVCRSYLRAQKLRPVSLDALVEEMPYVELGDEVEPDPQEIVVERELHFLMLEAVQLLSERNRAVILLFYYGQLSLREIASSLNISVVAVKSRLKQARKELRAHLLQVYPELRSISPTRKMKKMQTVTIADVLQQDPYSIAILIDTSKARTLPVWIGYWEGQAILSTLQNLPTTGPLSFTFTANLLQAAESEVEEVRIEALKDNVLYAVVRLRHGKSMKEVEARAGDALALAAQTNCAIMVEDSILNSMGMDLAAGQTKLAQEDLDRILHFMREKQPQGPLASITNRGSLTTYPDQLRNLDGSEGTSGWAMTGSHVQNYEYLFDTQIKQNGQGSFSIRSKVSETAGYGMLLQAIKADAYRGKLVRFSVMIKTEDVQRRTTLMVYAYGPNGQLKYASGQGGPRSGTQDWRPYDAIPEVPENCIHLAFGLVLSGTGRVWFSNIQFATVDQMPTSTIQRYPPAPRNLDFAQEAAEWVLWGGAPDHYEGGIDPDVTYHNARSLFIRGKVGKPEGHAYLVQYIAADAYLGKRVRLSALLKAEAVQAWGSQCLSIQGQHENSIFNSNVQQDPKYNLRLRGSSDWRRYEIVTIVPDHSSIIGFGLGLMGAGQIWFSEPSFEIVGDEVPLTTT